MSFTQNKAKDVGIIGIDVYFPKTAVKQEDLEKHDGVASGKYTIGLGQTNMAYVGDREDINSLAMTAVSSLLKKYNIPLTSIGRLEVGTETILDKSKSVKTNLMALFEKAGNTSIDGVDTINACYGGTSALHNSVQWMQSEFWDGRYALVVAGDIAIYEAGPARPTGGAGVVAMLIGPDAPLVIESGLRGVHMENAYDFYKPDMHSEYPTVDGKLSISCYLRAVDRCYERYREQFERKTGQNFELSTGDYAIFHSPYHKLVVKSYARMLYSDFLRNPDSEKFKSLAPFKGLKEEETWFNTDLEKALLALTKEDFAKKVAPSTELSRNLGNIYCGSLYAGLLSLIANEHSRLLGKRVMMFSYGSGLAASLFSFHVKKPVQHIAEKANVLERLKSREFVEPKKFVDALKLRETRHNVRDWKPSDPVTTLYPGTYYLESVDDKARRYYAVRELHTSTRPFVSSPRLFAGISRLAPTFSRPLAVRSAATTLLALAKRF